MAEVNNNIAPTQAEIKDKELREQFKKFILATRNNGVVSDKERITVRDFLATNDATILMPKVISQTVKEAVEPALIISNLFQTVRINSGRSIEFPAIGALEAEDIGEGSDYPEKVLTIGSGNVTAIPVTKRGLIVRISEDMINESQWDLIGLHLRAAGRALARRKEVVCATVFATEGFKVFDNLEPTAAVIGQTTGTSISGAFNGGLHLNDIFDMIAYLINTGFFANTIIMHPLAWAIIAKDPILRELAWMSNSNYWGGTFSGKVGETGWDDSMNLRYKTIAPALSTTQTSIPTGVFPVPLRVLVSPYVRFVPKGALAVAQSNGQPVVNALNGVLTNSAGQAQFPLTDIYILDDAETGIIVQREDVSTEEFTNPKNDIRNVKIKEKYGAGTLSQGKSIVVARNIAVTQTYTFNNVNSVTGLATPPRNI